MRFASVHLRGSQVNSRHLVSFNQCFLFRVAFMLASWLCIISSPVRRCSSVKWRRICDSEKLFRLKQNNKMGTSCWHFEMRPLLFGSEKTSEWKMHGREGGCLGGLGLKRNRRGGERRRQTKNRREGGRRQTHWWSCTVWEGRVEPDSADVRRNQGGGQAKEELRQGGSGVEGVWIGANQSRFASDVLIHWSLADWPYQSICDRLKSSDFSHFDFSL